MKTVNHKTPIVGTPFSVVPSFEMFVDRRDRAAYETDEIEILAEGVRGKLTIYVAENAVHVSASFGLHHWLGNDEGCEPLVIDDTRYSITLRLPPTPLSGFDFTESLKGDFEFSMANQDVRKNIASFDFPSDVEPASPLFVETRERFVRSVSRILRQIAADYPALGAGFREAVARSEIARLRQEQQDAWTAMVGRTEEIRRYMKLVPDEASKLAPEPAWTIPAEEAARMEIGFGTEGARMRGVGVEKVEIHQNSVASLLMIDLVDGTTEAHSLD